MTQEKAIKKLKDHSKADTTWIEKAEWRKANRGWLGISAKIATKTLIALGKNKEQSKYPKNQKELAEVLDCSPQYIKKLVKGNENLQISTILKLEKALGISLIHFVDNAEAIEDNYTMESGGFNAKIIDENPGGNADDEKDEIIPSETISNEDTANSHSFSFELGQKGKYYQSGNQNTAA